MFVTKMVKLSNLYEFLISLLNYKKFSLNYSEFKLIF